MAITNHERIGKSLELLKTGLAPFVEREFINSYKDRALTQALTLMDHDQILVDKDFGEWDVAALLKLMWEAWNLVFRSTLGPSERSLVSELRTCRNKWAHQENFSGDDTYRALDSVIRLLTAVSAPQSTEVEKMRNDLLRIRYDEQIRNEKRKQTVGGIPSLVSGSVKPWREVITPHKDVASGRYQQAEFAADLWQVHLGEGVDEYRDPIEFFKRTFLTDSLRHLLVDASKRLTGDGGAPVVQLQTNFGGGKTHSMLALYHLFSGVEARSLFGIDDLMDKNQIPSLPMAKRVVLVGNKISPGNPSQKPDGTIVHTLWGELAWQLGGKDAYERIRKDDEHATSPGDRLRELFIDYGPCLVLIDEWVAYARQLHDNSDLPGGSFETQFTFAQTLTEAAKLAKNCLVVISLPASDSSNTSSSRVDDVEVGGQRGREALERLRNVIGRLESSWRPASAEEGFEIVRRRLFEPLTDSSSKDRDFAARTFADYYRTNEQEFPAECKTVDYEKRIRAAYPIHPEIFDRLYNDWSTLVKFQRTRAVLRLMAAVIHSLWAHGDKNPLILPASIPIDDQSIQFELTRYLSDNWTPIIEKDVDGGNSLPASLDSELPALGKYAACRRVARTIYLGSAPMQSAANRGVEDRRVKLGSAMPGESPSVFGDALRRLAASATYLYQDGSNYWYDTQPTVTKLADDRAGQVRRDPDQIAKELERRLRANLRHTGAFNRIHILPSSSADVPDENEARLVVMGSNYPHSAGGPSAAVDEATMILGNRGNGSRIYQNSLVFLAVDQTRLAELEDALCKYLAWESILSEKEQLNLSRHQIKQAENQVKSADSTLVARLPEAYQWLLVPEQENPLAPIAWQRIRLSGQDSLAVRAVKKLINEELLFTSFAAIRLRMAIDKIPLWRGNHVSVKQLVEDMGRYLYLPRMLNTDVLIAAIDDGLCATDLDQEGFAFAHDFDKNTNQYQGLRIGQLIPNEQMLHGLVVKPVVAKQQSAKPVDSGGATLPPAGREISGEPSSAESINGVSKPQPVNSQPTRYHATVDLNPKRVGRDAGKIAEEVVCHLVGILGSNVKISLEIEAVIPDGVSEQVVRVVTENGRTLKFTNQGFERDL